MIAPPPPGATRLFLLRHGEPEVDTRGRCYGRLDVGLSPRGVEQAGRAAALLYDVPIAAVYASPRRRAIESARPLARPRGLEVRVDPDLREIDFGALEGLSYDEARVRHPELYRAWMERPTEVTFPGGESYADLRARVLGALGRLRGAHAGATIAVVAHGGVTRTALADALGVEDAYLFRIAQDHAVLNAIDWIDGVPIVRLVNAAPGYGISSSAATATGPGRRRRMVPSTAR
jgi:broad specificity phosphatase PhoE